jgi:N-acetylglucosaminyl-diphospho-decaprenol L-rhamnosyltransferase
MTNGISALVVTYNSAHCIERCLRSISEHLQPSEIVVVDNASADGTAAVVRRAVPEAIVIESPANVGFGRACNQAADHASGDVLAFVNPDVEIGEVNRDGLLRDVGAARLGLVVPLLAQRGGAHAYHPVFPYRPWQRVVRRQAWAHLKPRELNRPVRPARDVRSAWAAATLLFARRAEFRELGGFDPRYFLYGEDLDLSRRYREAGFGLALTESLTGRHAGAASSVSGDDLHVAPLGWSLLGTLEYLSIWHGDAVARRAAARVLRTFRLQRRLLDALARVPGVGRRAVRKRAQVEQLEGFLLGHANADGGADGFCPGARTALREAR